VDKERLTGTKISIKHGAQITCVTKDAEIIVKNSLEELINDLYKLEIVDCEEECGFNQTKSFRYMFIDQVSNFLEDIMTTKKTKC